LIIFFFILFIPEISAQNIPELVTDRPDVTESPLTVPVDAFQIELGFLFQKQKFTALPVPVEKNNLILAGTLCRYGVSKNIEFRFGGEYFIGRTIDGESESFIQGIRDISLGLKINLRKDEKLLSDIGVIIQSAVPFGNEKLRPDNFLPAVIVSIGQPVNRNFSFGCNIGLEKNSEGSGSVLFYSGSLTYDLGGIAEPFLEFYGRTFKNSKPLNYLNFGITYLFRQNVQVDISFGTSLTNGLTDNSGGFGISLRLPD
ncbi:MAG: transporter, partial [Melioribacteraceae bacterium]